MPEMQAQIDALREAFSADTSKPFELKNSFPYNSPGSHLQPSPPLEAYSRGPAGSRHSSHDQASYTAQPITPPISAGHEDSQDNSLAAVSMVAGGHQRQQHPLPQNTLGNDILAWNPTRIFEYETHISHNASMSAAAYIASPSASPCPVPRYVPHHMRQRVIVPHADTSPPSLSQWNTAFGTTPVNSNITNTVTQSSPTVYTPSSISSHDLPHLQDAMLQQQAYPLQQQATPLTHLQRSQTNSYTSTSPSFVSPSMWQDTVASTFDPGGLKRRWNPASSYFGEPTMNKRSK
ncbi:hypothetical protein MMC09_006856 [Bachmanniomyces sp. S44760]|nr:hypothetical protein [Bachmanniomyces sp. S44760]